MKKIIEILVVSLFFFFLNFQQLIPVNARVSPISLQGQGVVLIEENTGEILFEKNMNQKMYPASTTKIMTALLALEYGNLEDVITVGKEIEGIPDYSNKANLVIDQKIPLYELLYGLMLPSGNDAANTVAIYIAKKATKDSSLPQEEALNIFAELATKKAEKLGANHTQFKNPHGFHDNEHYTTPLDMAMIAREAMKNKIFREIVSTPNKSYSYKNVSSKKKHTEGQWENTNHLILKDREDYYSPATGVKTGNTLAAGKCLVSSATKDDLNLITVILKSTNEDIWEDSRKVLSYGFEHFENHTIIEKGKPVKTVMLDKKRKDSSNTINIVAKSTLKKVLNKKDILNITREIAWESKYIDPSSNNQEFNPLFSIRQGETIGHVLYYLNGETLGQSELTIDRDLIIKKDIFKGKLFGSFLVLFLIILSMFALGKHRKHPR